MKILALTCLPALVALLWTGTASAAAAPPSVKVDSLRVVPLADSFAVFFREESRRVQAADIARTGTSPTPKPTTCVIGTAPKDPPTEVGYDVVGGESDYTILFSGVSLGSVHRGAATTAQGCSAAPDVNFQTHAPGVRLSQVPPTSKAVLLHAPTLANFATYVDITREDGSHTVIESRQQTEDVGPPQPVFVAGKTALLVYRAGRDLWAQTFDTEKGIAIDVNARQLATDLVLNSAVLAYPESVEGHFRMVYSREPRGNEPAGIYEGHLRGNVFSQTIVNGVNGSLVAGTLDTNGAQPQQVLVTMGSSNGSLAHVPIFNDALTSSVESVALGNVGVEASVGCRQRTCLIAHTSGHGWANGVGLIRIANDKVESLPSIPVTTPPYVGRPSAEAGTGSDNAAKGGSGCSVRSHPESESMWCSVLVFGGALFFARRRRSPQA